MSLWRWLVARDMTSLALDADGFDDLDASDDADAADDVNDVCYGLR